MTKPNPADNPDTVHTVMQRMKVLNDIEAVARELRMTEGQVKKIYDKFKSKRRVFK